MLSIFDERIPMLYSVLFIAMSFILGAVIGSFLNVVILRIPRHEPISGIGNRSHCMSCGQQLKNIDLIPILSYIFLGGKCRFCKSKISPRYWIVELTTAILYTLAIIVFGISVELLFAFVLIAALVVASGIDIDKMEIPYGTSLVIALLGVASTIISAVTGDMPWYDHLIGAVAVSVPFAVLALFGAMGGGDVQLMAAAGLLLGWKNIIPAAGIGIVLGAIGGGLELLTVPKGFTAKTNKSADEIVRRWYDEQKENGAYVIEDKTEALYGNIFNGKSDIEEACLDLKCWSEKPDIAKLNEMLDAELTEVSRYGISIVIENLHNKKKPEDYVENGKIRTVTCKRQIAFGPYLAAGIAAGYMAGTQIITWYLGLM